MFDEVKKDNQCEWFQMLISCRVDQEDLTEEEESALDGHLSRCKNCQEQQRNFQQLGGNLENMSSVTAIQVQNALQWLERSMDRFANSRFATSENPKRKETSPANWLNEELLNDANHKEIGRNGLKINGARKSFLLTSGKQNDLKNTRTNWRTWLLRAIPLTISAMVVVGLFVVAWPDPPVVSARQVNPQEIVQPLVSVSEINRHRQRDQEAMVRTLELQLRTLKLEIETLSSDNDSQQVSSHISTRIDELLSQIRSLDLTYSQN